MYPYTYPYPLPVYEPQKKQCSENAIMQLKFMIDPKAHGRATNRIYVLYGLIFSVVVYYCFFLVFCFILLEFCELV